MSILKFYRQIRNCVVLAAVLVGGASAVRADTGVLALYKTGQQGPALFEIDVLKDQGCEVRLQGRIFDAQGNLDITRPDEFLFLSCVRDVLTQKATRTALRDAMGSGKFVAMFEGQSVDFPIDGYTGAVAERQYVIKLSHYNNLDIEARELDLMALNEEAIKRADTYVTESFLEVHRAEGINTPDEAVILFYDTAEKADAFRQNNRDLLEQIGAFNTAHLTDFTYLIGQIVDQP